MPAVSQYSPPVTPALTRSPTARATMSWGTMSIRASGAPGSTGTCPFTMAPSARVSPCIPAIRPVTESPITTDGRMITPGTGASRTTCSAAVLEARYAAAPGKRSCSSGASGLATKAVLMWKNGASARVARSSIAMVPSRLARRIWSGSAFQLVAAAECTTRSTSAMSWVKSAWARPSPGCSRSARTSRTRWSFTGVRWRRQTIPKSGDSSSIRALPSTPAPPVSRIVGRFADGCGLVGALGRGRDRGMAVIPSVE